MITGGDVAQYTNPKGIESYLNVFLYRRANEYKAVTHSIYLGRGKTLIRVVWMKQQKITICRVGPRPTEFVVGLRFSCFSKQPIVTVDSFEKVSVEIDFEYSRKKHSDYNKDKVKVKNQPFWIDKDLDLVQRVTIETPKGKLPKKSEMTSIKIFTLVD